MRTGLRTEVGVMVAFFMALGSGLLGTIVSHEMSELASNSALREGRAILDAVALSARAHVTSGDQAALSALVRGLAETNPRDLAALFVLDREGHVLAAAGAATAGGLTGTFGASTSQIVKADHRWHQFGPNAEVPEYLDLIRPLGDGREQGALVARFSLTSLNTRILRLERWIAFITGLAALVGWTVVFVFLGFRVIGPMRQLAEMGERLGQGELDVRSKLQRSDEIGSLGKSLELMAERLKRQTTELEALVKARTQALEDANRELAQLATTDGLTGLKNYRSFRTTLEFELKRGERHTHPLALCMLDIDHFKAFNDNLGHPAGDEALRKVGRVLTAGLRSTDVVARYGGEEFVVILLDTARAEALLAAEKINAMFRAEPFEGESVLPNGKLTLSVGVASFPDDASTSDQLIHCADLALYEAKRRGRNQVVQYDSSIASGSRKTGDLSPG